MSRGFFVAVEGLGGLGKTTLADSLAEDLRVKGYEVLRTREPGGTYGAEILRDMLRTGRLDDGSEGYGKFSGMGMALIFNAARIDHVEKIIKPALEEGKVVICDRYRDSTIAIQSAYNGIEPRTLIELHRLVIGLLPDLTILLSGSTELANSRLRKEELTGDQFDRADKLIKDKIALTHYALANNCADHDYSIIEASFTHEEVLEAAYTNLEEKLHQRGVTSYPESRKLLNKLAEIQDPELLRILSTSQLSVSEIVEAVKDWSKKNPRV